MGVCAGSGSPMRSGNKGGAEVRGNITKRWVPQLPGGGVLWQLRGLCGENRGTGSSERRRGHKLRRARSCCGGAFSCCFAGVSLLRFATHVRSFVQGHTLQCSKARGWDQTRHATAYVCDCPGSLPLLVRVGFHCRSGVVPFVPPARSLSPLSVVVSCVPKPRPRSVLGMSAVSQLSMPSGLGLVAPVVAPAGVHRVRSPRCFFLHRLRRCRCWGVPWHCVLEVLDVVEANGIPQIAVVQLCSSCKASAAKEIW